VGPPLHRSGQEWPSLPSSAQVDGPGIIELPLPTYLWGRPPHSFMRQEHDRGRFLALFRVGSARASSTSGWRHRIHVVDREMRQRRHGTDRQSKDRGAGTGLSVANQPNLFKRLCRALFSYVHIYKLCFIHRRTLLLVLGGVWVCS
jgi:hypothetical protein